MDAVVLESPDQFKSGAVPYMSKTRVAVTAEVALGYQPFLVTVEQSTPFFQLGYSFCSFAAEDFDHAPVVKVFSASNSVTKVNLPVVSGICVAQGGSHTTFRHHRMCFSQE